MEINNIDKQANIQKMHFSKTSNSQDFSEIFSKSIEANSKSSKLRDKDGKITDMAAFVEELHTNNNLDSYTELMKLSIDEVLEYADIAKGYSSEQAEYFPPRTGMGLCWIYNNFSKDFSMPASERNEILDKVGEKYAEVMLMECGGTEEGWKNSIKTFHIETILRLEAKEKGMDFNFLSKKDKKKDDDDNNNILAQHARNTIDLRLMTIANK